MIAKDTSLSVRGGITPPKKHKKKKKRHDFSTSKEIHLHPEITKCPKCRTKLTQKYSRKRKVISLKGIFKVVAHVKRCPNSRCSLYDKPISPEKEWLFALKYRLFGVDILVFIGQSYFYKNLPATEIHNALVSQYQIDISRSEVFYLKDVFISLVKASVENDQEIIFKLRSQGGIILSIDGIQPVKGYETTYICRDIISGEVVLAETLENSSSEELEKLIYKVKQKGIPILAVVSDNQPSLVKAIRTQLPDVIHQVCQYHYLRDAFKPLFEKDSKLYKNIKRAIRGVNQIERATKKSDEILENEKITIENICVAIHEVLNLQGRYPFEPRGIKVYEGLKQIEATIEKCLQKKDSMPLRKLQRILHPIKEFSITAEKIKTEWQWLYNIAKLLEGKDNKYESYEQLCGYLKEIENQYNDTQSRVIIKNIIKVTNSFGSNLFSFLETPEVINPKLLPEKFEIPRTNNALEIFICAIKKAGRKITGRKDINHFVLKYGDKVAILYSLPKDIDWQRRFAEIDPATIKNCTNPQWRHIIRKKARKDLSKFLEEITQNWG